MTKRILALIIATVTLLSSMTVFAAPKTMPDGGTFDPEYYAQQYPDVAAITGNDENALYAHYVQYGKAEGRQPYGEYKAPEIPKGESITVPATDMKLGNIIIGNDKRGRWMPLAQKKIRSSGNDTKWSFLIRPIQHVGTANKICAKIVALDSDGMELNNTVILIKDGYSEDYTKAVYFPKNTAMIKYQIWY